MGRLAAGMSDAFLVIEIAPPDDFVQLSWSTDGFQLDHPLVTPSQRAREQRFRAFCTTIGREAADNPGTDGSQFLDCDLDADPTKAAAQVVSAIRALFGRTDQLRFSGHGLANVAV